ncbi:3-methyladenine DNA glycosidase [Aureobasidium sp. EXF-10727]|nr:3-methyladenine DNA glycosidase [Aureobasidium sp. EXF-10727]KAI4729829.1 3-methyladenine DNA glycosidase [Aureobasidium sp. EXF-10728]
MSLRRSARVQALPNTAATLTSQLKVTKRKATAANSKPSKPIKESLSASNRRQEAASTVNASSEQEAPRKRQKINGASKAASIPAADSLPTTTASVSSDNIKANGDEIPPNPIPRPAEPHITNAPVKSPTSNKTITAYSTWSSDTVGPALSTTNSLLDTALAHLKANDSNGRLAPFFAKFHCKVFDAEGLAQPINPFRSLASGIIAQQVSGAAASSIKNKFINLFAADAAYDYPGPPEFPPPQMVKDMPIPTLRTAGLSQRKAEYIQGLAEQFSNGTLSAEMLTTATDAQVMDKLIAVRGLGKWSVEMFACFDLKRMDVFSTGDLGVQRGLAVYTGKDVNKLKAKGGGKWKYMGSEQAMLDAAAKFSPYRSLFMWYMWRLSDVDLSALQDDKVIAET